jgi:glycosyltransferase involved in cell wall biosynthesis
MERSGGLVEGSGEAPRLGVTCAIMAYNEEASLDEAVREVVRELDASGRPYEVVIVDDGSRDATPRMADALASELSRPGAEVRAVHHARNRGPGSAIVTGVLEARQPLYCFHPADNQVRFADVAAALDLLDERYDLLVGQRSDRHDYSLARRVVSYGYIGLAWALFGLSGFRDFNFIYLWRTALVRPMLPLESHGVFLCTEILVRARDAGARIGVAPAAYRPRKAGVSTVGRPAVVLDTFGQMARFYARRQTRRLMKR